MNFKFLKLNLSDKDEGLLNQSLASSRLICIAGAILVPVFGTFHKLSNPNVIDFITFRIIIAFIYILILIFSYQENGWLQKNIDYCLQILYYVVSIFILYLDLLNGFSYDHSIALMMVILGSMVVGFRKNSHLVTYCATILTLTIFACFIVTKAQVNKVLFISNLLTACIIAGMVLSANIKAQKEIFIKEKLMKTIFDESVDALFLVDSATRMVIKLNKNASLLFELKDNNKAIRIDFLTASNNIIEEEWNHIIVKINRYGSWNKELEYTTSKRQKTWGDIVIKGIKIGDESMLLVRISDITERKQAEEALQQAKDELEKRVEERTTELSQSNLLLKQEISDRQRAEGQLIYSAFHDALTGLPNRALFMERLEQAIEQAKRHKNCLYAVLFLDLDRFKVVNDSLGHMAGDQLLLLIASRIKSCLRAEDLVARLGGDEFTILLKELKEISEAKHVAERIQEQLMLPFQLSGNEVFTTASIGIALSVTGYDRPEQILRDADMAMYRAKTHGKARHEVFDITMHSSAIALLQLETDLRRAIERQEFRLYYQPIISLNNGMINGFEALVRWQHPERGLISPAEFIPMAEETGLIIPIGWWVIREACNQMHIWQAQFPENSSLAISVNISGKQFSQPNLSQQIEQILQETSLDPRTFKLEITESAIVENAESATVMLAQLRKLGVQLYMDDFGTGYSSLSYLHRFPIDMLKIDRSFVSRMSFDNENSEIVRTIMTLAHNLGMKVTAEGVETAEQLALLKALKCDYGQGYFFCKPVDSETAETLITILGIG